MYMTQSVSLTPKGEEELNKRVYKLDMKKRNVLILLRQPRTVQYVVDKAVFDTKELMEEIVSLIKEGFLNLGGDGGTAEIAATAAAVKPVEASKPAAPAYDGNISIHEDIILSEARFLMVDFCVEVFKTSSSKFVEKLGACKNVGAFTECVEEIGEITKASYPTHLAAFQNVITKINQSAL